MTERSVASVILLSIFTCGIYGLYWFVVTTNEIERELGKDSDGSCASGGVSLLLVIITCGIYYLYWWFKEAKRVELLGEINGVRISDNSLVYIILSIFGLSLVSIALMQSDLNKVSSRIV